MPLPTIDVVKYRLQIPSTQEEIEFRPFLVKEEKILLMALEGEDSNEMNSAMKQIINNCTFGLINLDALAMFDIEYIFLKIRSRSVGEVSNISINCQNLIEEQICSEPNEFEINLGNIEVQFNEEHSNSIEFTPTMGAVMRYPSFETYNQIVEGNSQLDNLFVILRDCVDMIYEGDTIYKKGDFTENELDDFLENLTPEQFEKLNDFFDTMPSLSHDINFNCKKCGFSDIMTLETLDDFFG